MDDVKKIELMSKKNEQKLSVGLSYEGFKIFVEKHNENEREIERGNLKSLHTDHKSKIDSFLKSRKRKVTKEQVLKIISFLMMKKNENEGWVRSIDVLNKFLSPDPNTAKYKYLEIPESTFFKIMKDLENNDIIERKVENKINIPGRGTKPVYYRLRKGYRDIDLMTHEDLLFKIQQLDSEILKFAIICQILYAEIEKLCDKTGDNYSIKKEEIGKQALDTWNKNFKKTFGEWG